MKTLVAWLLLTSAAAAQIAIEPTYEPGVPIVARCQAEPLPNVSATEYQWSGSDGVSVIAVGDGREVHVWAPSAAQPHTLKLRVQFTIRVPVVDPNDPTKWTPTDFKLWPYEFSSQFTVQGSPTPPTPPTPPGPSPDDLNDKWGVGQLAFTVVSSLPAEVKAQAKPTAALFQQSAARLLNGEAATINSEIVRLKDERAKLWGATATAWVPFENAINQKFNEAWPLDKAGVAEFLQAIAAGLSAVQ